MKHMRKSHMVILMGSLILLCAAAALLFFLRGRPERLGQTGKMTDESGEGLIIDTEQINSPDDNEERSKSDDTETTSQPDDRVTVDSPDDAELIDKSDDMDLVSRTEQWEIYIHKRKSQETAELATEVFVKAASEENGKPIEISLSNDFACELPGEYLSILWNREKTYACIRYRKGSSTDFIVINPSEKKGIYHIDFFQELFEQDLLGRVDQEQTMMIYPASWLDDLKIRVRFSCFDQDKNLYQGSLLYDPVAQSLAEPFVELKSTGNNDVVKLGKLKNVSLNKLTERAITTSQTFYQTEYPLLAELPDEEVYLYGADDGVILRRKDMLQTFDWYYMTPRFVLPILQTGDFDEDGKEEIMVILYVASGTGVSISELHILEPDEDGSYRDILFTPEDYIKQLNKNVEYAYDKEENRLTIITGKKKELYDCLEITDDLTFTGISYGEIITFEYMDEIIFAAGAGFSFAERVVPAYYGSVTARVSYRDESFTLRDFSFIPEMDSLKKIK